MTTPTARASRLVYVADPMCSWCWGFSPVIAATEERFRDRVPVEVLLGGLRPGTTATMDERTKASIRKHWDHVAAASGQPFDYAFFDRSDFVYDTEPACRAVVSARRLEPRRALPFFARLQAAFYRDNRDVTDERTLAELAAEAGLDRRAFAAEQATKAAREETRRDFALARELGVSGYPTLLGIDGDRLTALTTGYRPRELVESSIESWLRRPAAR